MASFPTLRSGSSVKYPLRDTTLRGAGSVTFMDRSRQAWSSTLELRAFELRFTNINGYDFSRIVDFFRSTKGQFDTTWDITIGSTTYSNMMFVTDDLAWTENEPNLYTVRLPCRQGQP